MDKREEEAVQTDDEAVDFVFRELSAALGQDGFEVHDGTETWDGDVSATMYGILHAAGVIDDENKVATHAELTRLQSEIAALKEALKSTEAAISEYYRYWTGGEMRGSYDGKPERNAMWEAQRKARAALAAGGK